MPQLGESVTEGTVIRWLKHPGDAVALDEPLVEVETEKVDVEIPSPFAGTLTALLVGEGETVAVGAPLAAIAATEEPAPPPPAAPPIAPPAPAAGESARRLSPAVARLAAEHSIDPAALQGSGAGGRVTRQDVLAAAEARAAPAAAPPAAAPAAGDTLVAFSPLRRQIAANMVRSVQTAPHAWLLMEADVTDLVSLRQKRREEFRERSGVDLTYLAFVAQALCRALRAFPLLNATWAGDDLFQRGAINLGIAVNSPDGLIVPVLAQADRLSLTDLARAIADLADRARRRRLRLDQAQGGTFTLDNTGALGTDASVPIINHPEVAILTMDAIRRRPVVRDDDTIVPRALMNLSLSFDHRALDGATAAAFVAHLRDALQAIGPATPID